MCSGRHSAAAIRPGASASTVSYSLGRSFEEASLRAIADRTPAGRRSGSRACSFRPPRAIRQAARQVHSTSRARGCRTGRRDVRRAAAGHRAAAIRCRPVDELSGYAGAARSPAGGSEPAAGDARPSVGARQLRSAAAGAGAEQPAIHSPREEPTWCLMPTSAPRGVFRQPSGAGF